MELFTESEIAAVLLEENPRYCLSCGRKDERIAELLKACKKAVERAKVFDDGSDGADAESARSVVAILSQALTPNAAGKRLAEGKSV